MSLPSKQWLTMHAIITVLPQSVQFFLQIPRWERKSRLIFGAYLYSGLYGILNEFRIYYIHLMRQRQRSAGMPYSCVPAHKGTDHIFDARPMATEEVPFAWLLNQLCTHCYNKDWTSAHRKAPTHTWPPPQKKNPTKHIHMSIHPAMLWAGPEPAIPVL